METVKQWALSVCAAAVACGIAQMVLPRGSMEKIFKITVSVFFLCCLLSPLVVRSPELRMEWQEYAREDIERRAERLSGVAASQAERAVVVEVTKIVEEKLTEMGINNSGITININRNGQSMEGDGNAQEAMPQLDILLDVPPPQNHAAIQAALEEAVGLPVRLRYADRAEEVG